MYVYIYIYTYMYIYIYISHLRLPDWRRTPGAKRRSPRQFLVWWSVRFRCNTFYKDEISPFHIRW